MIDALVTRHTKRAGFADLRIGLCRNRISCGRRLDQNRRSEMVPDKPAPAGATYQEQGGGDVEQVVLQLILQQDQSRGKRAAGVGTGANDTGPNDIEGLRRRRNPRGWMFKPPRLRIRGEMARANNYDRPWGRPANRMQLWSSDRIRQCPRPRRVPSLRDDYVPILTRYWLALVSGAEQNEKIPGIPQPTTPLGAVSTCFRGGCCLL